MTREALRLFNHQLFIEIRHDFERNFLFNKKMEYIFNEANDRIADGARFSINFPNRSLKLNGKYIIKNGKFEGKLGVSTHNPVPSIEKVYDRYLHSIPSERSDHKRKRYFQALPYSELSDEDMLYGEPRETSQFILEFFILAAIINGDLTWEVLQQDNPKANWFWQSKNHPSLIIFKDWIKTNKTNTNN